MDDEATPGRPWTVNGDTARRAGDARPARPVGDAGRRRDGVPTRRHAAQARRAAPAVSAFHRPGRGRGGHVRVPARHRHLHRPGGPGASRRPVLRPGVPAYLCQAHRGTGRSTHPPGHPSARSQDDRGGGDIAGRAQGWCRALPEHAAAGARTATSASRDTARPMDTRSTGSTNCTWATRSGSRRRWPPTRTASSVHLSRRGQRAPAAGAG